MATNTYVALDKKTVSGSAVASIEFTGISSAYTDLVIVFNGTFDTFNNVRFQVGNGSVDTGSNYSVTRLNGDGSSATSDRVSNASGGYFIIMNASNNGMGIMQLQNYSNTTTYKTILTRGGGPGSSDYVNAGVNLWRSTSAITNIKIYPQSGNINVGSTFSLYGIAADTNSYTAKATGGTITADVGYIYHTFTSTGTFTPLQSLSCDVLVVAGGGGSGGSNTYVTGGGGAGGLLGFTSQSLSATGYTVTVGAGGSQLADGSNSQFGALTASVGGGYGGNGAGRTGGSGSGAGGPNTTLRSGGSGTSGQGNAGGSNSTSDLAGGGGGGAGAAGSNGSSNVGGNGGNGSSSYTIWGLATSTGQLVSGTYYYAGGGGGGDNSGSGAGYGGTGGYGGGGAGAGGFPGTQYVGANGTANTGGGAGGNSDYSSTSVAGANGGSGIVIVRYAK